eukprot:1161583-Pelagomonas_calceolata.AAC.4
MQNTFQAHCPLLLHPPGSRHPPAEKPGAVAPHSSRRSLALAHQSDNTRTESMFVWDGVNIHKPMMLGFAV